MKNIKVCVLDNNYIVVKADTKRFGASAILYEGNTFEECFNWIAEVTGRHNYSIVGRTYGRYRDHTGQVLPTEMDVLISGT